MRTRSFAALAAASVLIFAACGDDDEDAGGESTIAEVAPATAGPAAAPAGVETTEAGVAPAGVETTEAGVAPAGVETTEAGVAPAGVETTEAGVAPAGVETTEAGVALAGVETTEAGVALAGVETTEAGVAPAGVETTEAGVAPAGVETTEAGVALAGVETTEAGVALAGVETTEAGVALAGVETTEAGVALAGVETTEAGVALAGVETTEAGVALAGVETTEAAVETTEAAVETTEAAVETTAAPESSAPGTAPATSEPGSSVPAGEPGAITVGSADFPESQLLAQIYGQALEAAGFDVSYELGIGSREVYYGAIEGGEVGLVPEYTGSLLSFISAEQPTAANVDEQVEAIGEELPEGLEVLTPSTAEDKDVIVCTQDVVDEYSLTNLSSLFENSAEITLGGPPEMETRTPFGIEGFSTIYDAEFAEFVPLAPGDIPAALSAGEIDCGNIFSTDPAIDTGGFVALEDDLAIVPNEAVLPLVRSEFVTPELTAALDEVDSALDTETLASLVAEVVNEQLGVDVVAEEFLASLGTTTPETTAG